MAQASPPESREIARNVVVALLYKCAGCEIEVSAEKASRAFARVFVALKASKVRTDYHSWMADLTIALISTSKGTGDLDKEIDRALQVFEHMGNVLDNPNAYVSK